MMGLYGTLGLVIVLAGVCLLAAWLYFRRAGRRGSFPADGWEPYLQKGGRPTPWGSGVPEEVERVDGGEAPPAREPDEAFIASPPASDGSVPSRMKALDAFPVTADEERRREEQRRQIEDFRAAEPSPPPAAPEPEEGDPELLDLIASAPPPRMDPPPPAPSDPPPRRPETIPSGGAPPANGGHPWWEGLPAPKDVPFRLTVAQLMGIAMADSGAPAPAAPPWSAPLAAAPAERPPLEREPLERREAPPAGDASEAGEDFLGLGFASEEPSDAEQGGEAQAAAEPAGAPGGEAPDALTDFAEERPGEVGAGAEAGTETGDEEASLFAEAEAPPEASAEALFLHEDEEEPTAPLDLGLEDEVEEAGPLAANGAAQALPPPPPAPAEELPPAPAEELKDDAPVFLEEAPDAEASAAGEGADEEEALFLTEEVPLGEEEPALLLEEESRGAREEPGLPALPSEEEEEEEEEEGETLLLDELEEEPQAERPAAAAPPAGDRPGEGTPALPSEEEGGEDVFDVLRSERGFAAEDVPEEPIGNALLYESNEVLENVSEPEEAAPPGLPEAPPLLPAASAPPPGPAPEPEEPSPAFREEEEEETAAPAASPADLVRKLAADHCPGDLLFAEEGEVRLPAWAEGVGQAAESDLRERHAGKATVQPEEYMRLGIVEHLLGRHEEASGHFKEALRRARRLGPALNALAVSTFARGKVDPAIAYCKEAVREAGGDAALRAAAFRNLGFFYQVKGDPVRAAEATAAAIEAIGPKGDPAQLSRLHLRAGQLLRRMGEAERAREHLAESAGHFRKSGEDAEWARALVALASVQTELGEADGALKNLEEAARACRELGDSAGEALVLGQMGGTYTALDQFTRALGYYEKAVAIHREMGNRKGEAAHLSNIGNIHYFRGDLEEAEAAYEQALQINREEDHLVGQATSLGNLGRLHLERGDLDKARVRLTEARDRFKQAGAEGQLDKIRAMLEEVDREQGR